MKKRKKKLTSIREAVKGLPKPLKVLAIVSAASFLMCVVFLIVYMPTLIAAREKFDETSAIERELQRQLDELNVAYFIQMVDAGLFDIRDSENASVWNKYIYPRISSKFKYRLYFNRKLIDTTGGVFERPRFSGTQSILRIEEYTDYQFTTMSFPKASMVKYSQLLTGGTGVLRASDALVEVATTIGTGQSSVATFEGGANDSFIAAVEITLISEGDNTTFDVFLKDAKVTSALELFLGLEVYHD